MKSKLNLLFLPGNNIMNLAWSQEISDALKEYFGIRRVLKYHHWETGGMMVDFDYEKKQVVRLVDNFTPYIVIAKSAGVLLALMSMHEHGIMPERCVFMGTAVHLAGNLELPFHDWLEGYSVPTLWIQKEHDPAYGSTELRKLLKRAGVQNAEFVEIPGDIHHYELREIKGKVEAFLTMEDCMMKH